MVAGWGLADIGWYTTCCNQKAGQIGRDLWALELGCRHYWWLWLQQDRNIPGRGYSIGNLVNTSENGRISSTRPEECSAPSHKPEQSALTAEL